MCNSVSPTTLCTHRARPLLKSLVSQNTVFPIAALPVEIVADFAGKDCYAWCQQNVVYNSAIPTSLFSQQAQRLFKSLVSQHTNSIRHESPQPRSQALSSQKSLGTRLESPLKFEALVSNYVNLLAEAFVSRRYPVPFILGRRFSHFASFRKIQ